MGFTQNEIIATIPKYLHQFIIKQDPDRYSSEDHAVWRYIMRQHLDHLSKYAHPLYIEALEKTGIAIDHLPSIDEMNQCLTRLGWRAVVVNGYIPASAFMEFHAHRILPIALDMRTIDHIHYTPAPDIVHEAGGHAPFIADIDYGEYLQKFGVCGHKALSSKLDLKIYEAIRELSILKEMTGIPQEKIDDCEKRLLALVASDTKPSESSRLTRLYWWTVEYGLVGSVDDYKIFGAGLLSSIAESRSCLDDKKVRKIPLTIDCINTPFDITEPQPQLFVTKSCKHMSQVLEEFANHMCFKKGGADSIQVAIDSEIVATAEYSSGLQVSGQFTTVLKNTAGREIYINTTGPTQLSYQNHELEGHGTDYHAVGFGSPVGKLQNILKNLEDITIDELKDLNVSIGKSVKLEFLSGVTVKGKLGHILRKDSKNLVFTFTDCTVTDINNKILFQPDWGNYDMAVGHRIVSVYGGSADRAKFDTYPPPSKMEIPSRQCSTAQKELFAYYETIRHMREAHKIDIDEFKKIQMFLQKEFPQNWLLRLEMFEIVRSQNHLKNFATTLKNELEDLKNNFSPYRQLIADGLRIL